MVSSLGLGVMTRPPLLSSCAVSVLSGDHGDAWWSASALVLDDSFVFQGVRGTSWQGDIAIDDVTIECFSFPPSPPSFPPAPPSCPAPSIPPLPPALPPSPAFPDVVLGLAPHSWSTSAISVTGAPSSCSYHTEQWHGAVAAPNGKIYGARHPDARADLANGLAL
jgi:hypothetical protein